jgi:hypothetical protein
MFAHKFSLVSADSSIWPLFLNIFYMFFLDYLVLIIFRLRTIKWVFSSWDIQLNLAFNFGLLGLFLRNLEKCVVDRIIQILIISFLIIKVILYLLSFIYMLIIFGEILRCTTEKWFRLVWNLFYLFQWFPKFIVWVPL